MHAPLLQLWPVAQAVQVLPPVPQVAFAAVRHWPPASQQPLGQDAALQTHAPCALHAWFAPHATHCPPFAPHAAADAVMQTPFAQQPAQLMLPQLQPPLLQVWPVAQVPQALPPAPHAAVDCADCATQRPCESQHPFGHDVGLQTQVPAAPHACPLAHAAHALPAAPQVVADCAANATQVPFAWQQPPGQDAGVQAHLPVASQVCPPAQAAQATPWLPHAWLVAGTHSPPALQQPVQLVRSQAHAPAVQTCDGAHAVHAAPAVPQAAVVGGFTHCPFWSQQPLGHDAGAQRGTSVPASWLDPAAEPPAPAEPPVPPEPPLPAEPAPAPAAPAVAAEPPAPAVAFAPPEVPAVFTPPVPPEPGAPGPLPAAPVVIPTPPTHPASAGTNASNVHTAKPSQSERISPPF